ncbi:MAG: hypothetical protein RI906_3773 [Pseudomonadota bacterium]|jgi:predicted dehydrogenase
MKRLLMIGCGGFSRRYHVPTLLADPLLSIAGIFDPFPAPEVRALAEGCGAKLVSQLNDLPEADAALVTTPHTLHAQHVGFVLDRGMAALVDKPFVMRLDDARALADKARARGLLNAVGFNRRLDRGCVRAREIIASGELGTPRLVQTVQLGYEKAGWFLQKALGGGGAYTGRATHMADLVPWLLRQRPHALRSRLRPGTAGGDVDGGGFIDLEFDGIECQMNCIDQGLHMWDEVRIFGEKGLIELRRPSTLPTGWALTWTLGDGSVREQLAAEQGAGFITREFLAALHRGSPVSCTFDDAALSVEIIEAAFESAERQQRGRGDIRISMSAG